MANDVNKLSARESRFVQEYLKDRIGSAAYRRAGYKVMTDLSARTGASKLLAKVGVRAAIAAAEAELKAQLGIDALAILGEYAAVAFSDLGEIMDFSGIEPRLRPANEIPEK